MSDCSDAFRATYRPVCQHNALLVRSMLDSICQEKKIHKLSCIYSVFLADIVSVTCAPLIASVWFTPAFRP